MDTLLNPDEFFEESTPPPQSEEEYHFLLSLVSSISEFPRMSHKEQDILALNLEKYECYKQLDQLLRWRVGRPDRTHTQQLSDYVWLMKVHYLGLDDFDVFVSVTRDCMERLQIPFSTLRLRVLDEILGPENYRHHLTLLRAVAESVKDNIQLVLLLERVALICEKKLFLETEVEPTYNLILKVSPHNEKARKFKKLQHIHNMEWNEAAEQLKVLSEHTRDPQERARHRHELAQLYLYNLNQTGAALELLRPMSIQFPETRHTLIEAYERLEMHEDLLSALTTFERTGRDPDEVAQFKYRRGTVLFKMNRQADAIRVYKEALQLQPASLMIHEALISALLEMRMTAQLQEQLIHLQEVVQLDSSKNLLASLVDRASRLVEIADAK
jgi:tetratricopeptide (TPR) repeat protein